MKPFKYEGKTEKKRKKERKKERKKKGKRNRDRQRQTEKKGLNLLELSQYISGLEDLTVHIVCECNRDRHMITQSISYTSITSVTHTNTHIYIYIHHHHHHHVVPLSRISLTLSRHFSLSFITSSRSSGLHPISSHSCCMYVRDGRPAFARLYVGVHRSISLMSSSLLLQQCPACLVRLTWIVFVMGGRWPYSWCLVGCCRQDLFNIDRNILV